MSAAELETAVDQIADILHVRIGLRPDPTLRGRLVRAVREEVAHHARDHAAYVDQLLDDEAALQRLLNRVTVQETGFFRHPEHFGVLVDEVIPALQTPVTIWSAGCANGQEAYSLAMMLEEQGIEGSVIATDISTAALKRTRAARYTSRELAGLSPERLARHFTRDGDHWEVNGAVRDRVTTLRHNLLDPVPPEVASSEVVLCRNVLIYLSAEQIRAFLQRLADSLSQTTTLLVGAAETLLQVSDLFTATHLGDTFVYRLRPVTPISKRPAPVTSEARAASAGSRARTAVARSVSTPTPARRRSAPQPGPDHGNGQSAEVLEQEAQAAVSAGDFAAAVVAFRKCTYLRPHDPMAHLHLGLALEASGDQGPAQRAFAVARRALAEAGPEDSSADVEGYAPSELLRLLESRQ